jgi:hypothetical protein
MQIKTTRNIEAEIEALRIQYSQALQHMQSAVEQESLLRMKLWELRLERDRDL